MKRLRYWLSGKFAYWSLKVHPTSEAYLRRWETGFHVGPGKKCPNDPEWT